MVISWGPHAMTIREILKHSSGNSRKSMTAFEFKRGAPLMEQSQLPYWFLFEPCLWALGPRQASNQLRREGLRSSGQFWIFSLPVLGSLSFNHGLPHTANCDIASNQVESVKEKEVTHNMRTNNHECSSWATWPGNQYSLFPFYCPLSNMVLWGNHFFFQTSG